MITEPLRPVRPEEVHSFWEDGVVCLRGILPADDVMSLRPEVDGLVESGELADLTGMAEALGGTADGGPGQTRGRFLAGTDHWLHHPAFADFALRSAVPAVVAQVMDSLRVWLYEDSVLVKEPGAAEPTRWHQDLGYFHVDGRQLCTTWIPLDPVTAESGSLHFAIGSHHGDRVFRPTLFVSDDALPGTEGEQIGEWSVEGYRIVTYDLAPGDLTIHHARTLHCSGPNGSASTPRRAVSIRYCGDDALVHLRPGAPRKASQAYWVNGEHPGQAGLSLAWRTPGTA